MRMPPRPRFVAILARALKGNRFQSESKQNKTRQMLEFLQQRRNLSRH